MTRNTLNVKHLFKTMAMTKPKKPSSLCTTLFFIVLFAIPALFLLRVPITTNSFCTTLNTLDRPWAGDLRAAEFAWNRLEFASGRPSKVPLKIAVFSRKWPVGSVPGGMERHAYTLHTALTGLGHDIHVFTGPLPEAIGKMAVTPGQPTLHFHEGEPGKWLYNKAWEQYEEEERIGKFDVVHSESVSLPHWVARDLPNLAVSWHGIAMESLQSVIYQDLARQAGEHNSPAFEKNLEGEIPKVLHEIRFFRNYSHHIATSDSCGEMLRDVYQIPTKRVHVILNGMDENGFNQDLKLGKEFRSKINLPKNATLVLGTSGRLVKDKGHPILHQAFKMLISSIPNVYLIVVGSGPWEQRYRDLGPRVIVLGSMSPTQLNAFYNAIDIFVNPTLRPQGLDLTLMEVMMSGKPIMASRFPSIKGTIVVKEEFGYMFAPNVESLYEVLEAVVEEGAMRLARRGKACRDYAASMFSATKMALAYERLFFCIKNETYCSYP